METGDLRFQPREARDHGQRSRGIDDQGSDRDGIFYAPRTVHMVRAKGGNRYEE